MNLNDRVSMTTAANGCALKSKSSFSLKEASTRVCQTGHVAHYPLGLTFVRSLSESLSLYFFNINNESRSTVTLCGALNQ